MQRSNLAPIKLKDYLIESAAQGNFQRSNSNSAKMAKWFGYVAPTPAQVDMSVIPEVQMESKPGDSIQSISNVRSHPAQFATIENAPIFLNDETHVLPNSTVSC